MKMPIAALTLIACATVPHGDVDALKPTLKMFHEGMRWKDLHSLPIHVVPEKRAAFAKAADDRNDEKNLFVTDYQLEECKVQADQTIAICYSKVSWYRLPSATEKTVMMATTLKWEGGAWLIDMQSEGPFVEELSLSTQKATP